MGKEGLDVFGAVISGVCEPGINEGREGGGFVAGSDILVCHFVGCHMVSGVFFLAVRMALCRWVEMMPV